MSIIRNCLLASAAGIGLVIAGVTSAIASSPALNLGAAEAEGAKRPRRRPSWIGGGLAKGRTRLLSIASGLAVACLCYATASAAPIVVTWNPSASTPPLSIVTGPFSFNNATINNYTSIYLTPTGANTFSVTDQGFIPFVAFSNSGVTTTPADLDRPGGFGLYGQFTSTSTLTCTGGTAANCTGMINSLSLTLMGDPGYNTTFGFNSTTGNPVAMNAGGDVLLATGSLANCGAPSPTCQNMVGQANGVPSAAITTTFVPELGQSGFFVSPPVTATLGLLGSFINNTSEVLCYDNAGGALCDGDVDYAGALPAGAPPGADVLFQIGNSPSGLSPGGGSVTFFIPVPEPTSLGLLGPALIALFALGWQRRETRGA